MGDFHSIKVEVFHLKSCLISFDLIDGIRDLMCLINNQIFSSNPTIFLGSFLSEDDTHTLSLLRNQNAPPQGADRHAKAFSSLQKELWNFYNTVGKFNRGLKRGRRSNNLLGNFLHNELYLGEDESVHRRLNNILTKIDSSLFPIQRIIEISNYAEVMHNNLRISSK